jgi:hypothetical protein
MAAPMAKPDLQKLFNGKSIAESKLLEVTPGGVFEIKLETPGWGFEWHASYPASRFKILGSKMVLEPGKLVFRFVSQMDGESLITFTLIDATGSTIEERHYRIADCAQAV